LALQVLTQQLFYGKQKFAVELADAENILFLVTYADWQPEWPQVVAGIIQALPKMPQGKSRAHNAIKLPHADAVATAVSPREAFYGAKETVSLTAAAGRICAESIAFYPPGIPVILPGEIFTKTIIQYCQEMLPYHLVIHGAADKSLATVRVLQDGHREVKS
jgi:arginine/lysine/ornithine decarboxylase